MKPAVYDQTTVDVKAGAVPTLRANGQVLKFAGYTAVYTDSAEETGERPTARTARCRSSPRARR